MGDAKEILKDAILLEKRGQAFYSKVADQAENKAVKEFFEMMAEEEVSHIKILSEQYKNLKTREGFSRLDLASLDSGQVAADVLSKELKEAIASADYEAAAISAAISMEEKAIALYSARAETATDRQEQKLYKWLSDWEQKHLDMLLNIDAALREKIWHDNNFWPL